MIRMITWHNKRRIMKTWLAEEQLKNGEVIPPKRNVTWSPYNIYNSHNSRNSMCYHCRSRLGMQSMNLGGGASVYQLLGSSEPALDPSTNGIVVVWVDGLDSWVSLWKGKSPTQTTNSPLVDRSMNFWQSDYYVFADLFYWNLSILSFRAENLEVHAG